MSSTFFFDDVIISLFKILVVFACYVEVLKITLHNRNMTQKIDTWSIMEKHRQETLSIIF